MTRRLARAVLAAAALSAAGVAPAFAQGAGQPLAVGVEAPDFELTGATRYGLLRDRISLSDYRGKTVVLAFFYRARTPG